MRDKALIEEYEIELCDPACFPGASFWAAKAHIPNDISEVMPYLNAVLDKPFYSGDKQFIVWKDSERKFALRPNELAVSLILDREQALELVEKAVDRINGIWERRDEITPDDTKRTPPKVLDILKLLPRTNCKDCGLQSCMAFAAELIEGNKRLEDCPYLLEDENAEALQGLKELGL
jgi:ArsR family metal-binding transcriptional regulator